MLFASVASILSLFIGIAVAVVFVYFLILAIKALRKYIQSADVRKEKTEFKRTLGEVLKEQRISKNVTQEFVAETLGVSRQAVSKWENGISDPSTSNLIAIAKLYGTTVEELLKRVQ